MKFITHAAQWLLSCPPVRRRVVSALAILAIATGGVSTTRPAWAPTAVEYAVALSLLITATITVITVLGPPGGSGSSDSLAAPMSCPVFAGSGTILGEDSCAWAKAAGQWVSQTGTNANTSELRIGGQVQVAPDWFLGGAFGAGSRWTRNDVGPTGSSQIFDGSVALKHTIGPWLFAGALALSSTAMHLTPPGTSLAGDTNVSSGGLRLRGAYDVAFSGWYLRPRLDLDLMHTWRPGFQVSGPNVAGLALAIDGSTKTSFVATPMLELGGRVDLDETLVLRPYVAVGASFLPDNSSTLSATVIGPLPGVGNLQSTVYGPSVLGNVEAGLQLYKTRGLEVKAEYMLSVGDNYLGQGASLRGAWHF
jgi:autotransporter-like protein